MGKRGPKPGTTKGHDTSAARKAAAEKARIFDTGEEFTAAAEKYFDECDSARMLYDEAGLCLGLKKYGPKGKSVKLGTLHDWYDNDGRPDLQEAVQMAYLRIQHQIETDPRYMEKGGMTSKAMFLLKQKYLGGKTDKQEMKQETTVHIVHGDSVDESDFK